MHPLLRPLSSAAITLEDYKLVIAAFYLSYANMQVQKFDVNLPDSPVVEWLEKDVKYHNIKLPSAPPALMPPVKTLSGYVG